MNHGQLEAMLAVVDHGSYAAAADLLQISQPSLSKRIKHLEQSLGVPVFAKVGRKMVITDFGRDILAPARRMVREVAEVRAVTQSTRGLTAGTLKIAGLPSLVSTHVPGLMGRFHQRHPDVRVEVTGVDDPQELVDAVRLARFDVAVGDISHVGDDLSVVQLEGQEFVAVLAGADESADLHAGASVDVDATMLAERTLVTLPRGTSTRSVTDAVYTQLGVQPPRVIMTTQRDALIHLAVAAGGMTVVPRILAEATHASGARMGSFNHRVSRPIGLVYRGDAFPSPVLSRFLELNTGF